MHFRIFSLLPQIFESFFGASLIARGLAKQIITKEVINWREEFGIGEYKQVDDRPFGGGTGMVLMIQPIYTALTKYLPKFEDRLLLNKNKNTPPNNEFYKRVESAKSSTKPIKNVIISLTPRGHKLNQKVVEWIAESFTDVTILCGRYEGFDSRLSNLVDLEISLGDYITNGGETPCMILIESVSRLVPGFVTKTSSVEHDSFSSELNHYSEQTEYVIGKKNLNNSSAAEPGNKTKRENNLFDDNKWLDEQAPQLEHPVYTRPENWRGMRVPEVLVSGDHKRIDIWRKNWNKDIDQADS